MTRLAATAVLCSLLAGCGFLSRPKNEFYSLDTVPGAGVVSVGGAPVGLDGIELPPGLDRRGIVIRGADSRVEVRGTNQWTAPLEEMVTHTLAFDLANRLPEGMVILPGQAKPAGAMRSIYVTFEDLAPGQDGLFVLDARWTLTAGSLPGVTHHERITLQLESLASPAVADGMSRALGMLADRIAAGLR